MTTGFQSEHGRAIARVWGVGALVQAVGDTLAVRFATCLVRGELSGFTRAASGHGYFTLKDEHGGAASMRCAMFRHALSQVDFSPVDGMLVEVRGDLAVYEARGELQLVVKGMQRAGAGALYEQYLRLKAKLEAEGLFDSALKRTVPACPSRIAVVTSLAAAALGDVLTALRRRAPHVEVVLAPSSVQGVEAPAQLVQALAQLTLAHRAGLKLDAVIVCRGGGAMEDLWAFNDERVVRAVRGCPVPVISGVGHETDVTLVDFAADLRAPTPTAAAELVARDRQTVQAELDAAAQFLQHRVGFRLGNQAQRLDRVAARLVRPSQWMGSHREAVNLLAHRLGAVCQSRVHLERQGLPIWGMRLQRAAAQQQWRAQHQTDTLHARLHALNPQRVLERGYAWLSNAQGAPLSQIKQAHVNQPIVGVLADGVLQLRVTGVAPASSDTSQPPEV